MSAAAGQPSNQQLAMNRTWLAHERTLMAWVRTATSMISFGFTIYKFFQLDIPKLNPGQHMLLTPREFGLIMISVGLIALISATITNHREMRELRPYTGDKRSIAELIALIVSAFGVFALFVAFFHG